MQDVHKFFNKKFGDINGYIIYNIMNAYINNYNINSWHNLLNVMNNITIDHKINVTLLKKKIPKNKVTTMQSSNNISTSSPVLSSTINKTKSITSCNNHTTKPSPPITLKEIKYVFLKKNKQKIVKKILKIMDNTPNTFGRKEIMKLFLDEINKSRSKYPNHNIICNTIILNECITIAFGLAAKMEKDHKLKNSKISSKKVVKTQPPPEKKQQQVKIAPTITKKVVKTQPPPEKKTTTS